jgi:hypothetical protein
VVSIFFLQVLSLNALYLLVLREPAGTWHCSSDPNPDHCSLIMVQLLIAGAFNRQAKFNVNIKQERSRQHRVAGFPASKQSYNYKDKLVLFTFSPFLDKRIYQNGDLTVSERAKCSGQLCARVPCPRRTRFPGSSPHHDRVHCSIDTPA